MTGRHAVRTLVDDGDGDRAAGPRRHLRGRDRRRRARVRAPAAARGSGRAGPAPRSTPRPSSSRASAPAHAGDGSRHRARRPSPRGISKGRSRARSSGTCPRTTGTTAALRRPVEEVVRDRTRAPYLRVDVRSAGGAPAEPESDDALEPRLELQEWNAPPATATSWRVTYAPAEPQPDGSTLVRWTGVRRRRRGGDRARRPTEPRAHRRSPPGVGPDDLAHGRDRVHRLPGRDHARAPRAGLR